MEGRERGRERMRGSRGPSEGGREGWNEGGRGERRDAGGRLREEASFSED